MREVFLAAVTGLASGISSRHASEVARSGRAFIEPYELHPVLRAEATAVLWCTYINHLTEHLSSTLGKDTAIRVLRQVLEAHTGETQK